MVFVQYASGVNINDLRCASMWAGIASILPVSGAFDDYTVRNSKFGNIQTNASKPMVDGAYPAAASCPCGAMA
jgi:hypothetical protein